jgi:hypothetical protein
VIRPWRACGMPTPGARSQRWKGTAASVRVEPRRHAARLRVGRHHRAGLGRRHRARGRGVIENNHSTDVEYPLLLCASVWAFTLND